MAVYHGIVKDNRVILDGDTTLPDGTSVEVRPRLASTPALERALREGLYKAGLLVSASRAPMRRREAFEPIHVDGEPLSQTIIAERR